MYLSAPHYVLKCTISITPLNINTKITIITQLKHMRISVGLMKLDGAD